MRIKDNLFLIPEQRFPDLVKDPDLTTSLVYLVACLVLAIPVKLAVGFMEGAPLFDNLLYAFVLQFLLLPIAYLLYGVGHFFLVLVGGTASFKQSVQIFIYGGTLALIIGSFPVVGFIAGLIALANMVMGASKVHHISLARTLVAIIVQPVILFIVLIFLIAALLGTLLIPML